MYNIRDLHLPNNPFRLLASRTPNYCIKINIEILLQFNWIINIPTIFVIIGIQKGVDGIMVIGCEEASEARQATLLNTLKIRPYMTLMVRNL